LDRISASASSPFSSPSSPSAPSSDELVAHVHEGHPGHPAAQLEGERAAVELERGVQVAHLQPGRG